MRWETGELFSFNQKLKATVLPDYTVKRIAIFPSPAGMSLVKISLVGKN